MDLYDILRTFLNEEGQFNDYFIQMFVNSDNSLAFADFNRLHESNFTHKQILKAILDLTGSKVVKYCIPAHDENLFEHFKEAYEFGVYPIAKDWNIYLDTIYGEVLPRAEILTWIAKQHPKRVQGSFLPTNDRNLYAKEESVSRSSTRSEEA